MFGLLPAILISVNRVSRVDAEATRSLRVIPVFRWTWLYNWSELEIEVNKFTKRDKQHE